MTMNAIQPNQVLDCARPIFYLVSDVKANSENLSDNFFDEVIEKFSEFERDASQKSINSRMVHEAKYALAAFVDELVLSSNYPKKPQWMSKPLQLELFGEHLAGEGFYQHLSELRQLGAQFVDVIEVYYICIQLGFMGKYRLQQQEAFLGLQADLRSQIEAIRGSNDPWLSSNAIPKEGVLAKVSREIPSWVMASVAGALIIFIYFGFTLSVNSQLNRSVTNINASKSALVADLQGYTQKQYMTQRAR